MVHLIDPLNRGIHVFLNIKEYFEYYECIAT